MGYGSFFLPRHSPNKFGAALGLSKRYASEVRQIQQSADGASPKTKTF